MKSQTGTEIKPFCVIWGKTKDGGWISLKSMWGSVQQLDDLAAGLASTRTRTCTHTQLPLSESLQSDSSSALSVWS